MPELRNFLASHPERAEAIANHLLKTAYEFGFNDVPKEFHFIYRFDDAFSAARERGHGELKKVTREFTHELEKFNNE